MERTDRDALFECGYGPVVDAAMKCESVLDSHFNALVSVSGGADSDVMLDLIERVRVGITCDVTYLWNDTGLEWSATRSHLNALEEH